MGDLQIRRSHTGHLRRVRDVRVPPRRSWPSGARSRRHEQEGFASAHARTRPVTPPGVDVSSPPPTAPTTCRCSRISPWEMMPDAQPALERRYHVGRRGIRVRLRRSGSRRLVAPRGRLCNRSVDTRLALAALTAAIRSGGSEAPGVTEIGIGVDRFHGHIESEHERTQIRGRCGRCTRPAVVARRSTCSRSNKSHISKQLRLVWFAHNPHSVGLDSQNEANR